MTQAPCRRKATSSSGTAKSWAASLPLHARRRLHFLRVGLAYVAPDQAEPGQTFTIRVDGGQMVTAATVALPFYDPANKCQEM